MTDKADWLAGLKVGDPVLVQDTSIGGCSAGALKTVERFTNTQIVTKGGCRYRRDDGRQIGGSAWHPGWLEEATTEKRDAVKAYRLASQLKGTKWNDVPLAILKAVTELVTQARKAGR